MSEPVRGDAHRSALLVVAIAMVLMALGFFGLVSSYKAVLPGHFLGPRTDLILHFAAFALLAALLGARLGPGAAAAFAILASVAIEATHLVAPERTASLEDIGASVAGVLVGLLPVAWSRAPGADRGSRHGAARAGAGRNVPRHPDAD